MQEIARILLINIVILSVLGFTQGITLFYVLTQRKIIRLQEKDIDSQLSSMSALLEDIHNLGEEIYACRKMMSEINNPEATLMLQDEPITPENFTRTVKYLYTEKLKEEDGHEGKSKIINIR
jgi:hypothetical protein